jgi:hypothetical protein
MTHLAHRSRLAAATTGLALLVAAGIALHPTLTAPADALSSGSSTTYVAHDQRGNLAFEDLGSPSKHGPDLGDILAFTQTLTQHGATVGRVSNVAVGIDHKRHLFHATGTVFLAQGNLEFAGIVSQTPHFEMSVTGGTGEYVGATGTVTFDSQRQRQLLTITLTDQSIGQG